MKRKKNIFRIKCQKLTHLKTLSSSAGFSDCLEQQHYSTTPILKTVVIKRIITQNVVKLIQVVLPRKDWPVGQHLSQDATHGPDVYGLGIALRVRGTKTQS